PAPGRDQAPALAELVVADRAEDVVALLAPLDQGGGDLHRVLLQGLAVLVEPAEEGGIRLERAARDGALWGHPRRATVRPEVRGALGLVLRLVGHVGRRHDLVLD